MPIVVFTSTCLVVLPNPHSGKITPPHRKSLHHTRFRWHTQVQHGSLSVWIDEEVLVNWHPEPQGKRQRGGQLRYSDQAIETLPMLRAV